MEYWLWAVVGIMAVFISVLVVKICILQKAAKEIENAFAHRLITDTNTLMDISSRDKYMRSLANTMNVQLRQLRIQRRRFQQGDMELKDAITNISHDLRTPLTAILGYLDLLEQEETSETTKRYIEVIRDRAEMLMQLTEELFCYSVVVSKEENTLREAVVINSLLEESVAAFYTALRERNITPVIRMPEAKVIRTLNHSSVSRVFSNLLNNAIKYSDGDLTITLYETGEIVFANTASRLNEVQAGKLFDRFYTVEAARKSTGLGLSIAKTLVEQMKGFISAKYENHRLSIHILFPDDKEN